MSFAHINMRFIGLVSGVLLLASPIAAQSQEGNAGPEEEKATPGSIFDRSGPDIEEQMIERIKEQPLNWHFGVSFMVANPQDSLRRALQAFGAPGVGYGFALTGGYYFDPVPVSIAAEFAMNFFGGTSRSFVRDDGPFFNDTIRYETLNLQMPFTLAARLQPNLFTWVYPYVEGVGGFMVYNSSLTVSRTSESEQDTEGTSETSASWLYGAGAGIMIKTADIITLPNVLQRILIDVRFRYLRSTSADVPTIEIGDNESFKIVSAPIPDPSFVMFNAGISVMF